MVVIWLLRLFVVGMFYLMVMLMFCSSFILVDFLYF
jgi:hypothetical protein